ncbi:MAG: rhodanese-like domain-containing protein, partial [Bacteroidales bacterium]
QEFRLGAIEQAINIPLDEIRVRMNELPTDRTIYVYCKAGMRGYIAARILQQSGYNKVHNLQAGYDSYQLFVKNQEHRIV